MDLENFVVARLDPAATRATRDDLDELWTSLLPDTYAARQGRSVFLRSVEEGLTPGGRPGAELEFRPGGWEVDLTRAATKTVVASAFLGGLLAVLGTAQLPAAVAAAVLPMLFEIRRVQLKASEQEILADLTGNAEIADGKTPDELYAALSPEIREQLSRLEFADFLDSLRRAGLLDQGDGDIIKVRPAGSSRFRITLK
ncbi:hypothetical protein OWR29_23660 [Actinoplanes sp. Pm04-4]|uniref:Uncharacterized protein n=1 Tax=Paractinoplanes pyxinae TaxID=2997416 RepID=A0ABT4B3E8_9ACTN|nr:hypothetical protein [Actinoplanes pyxinae]MCY1141005.1 hypothetical protein [Actinoplanes pyxinae]